MVWAGGGGWEEKKMCGDLFRGLWGLGEGKLGEGGKRLTKEGPQEKDLLDTHVP